MGAFDDTIKQYAGPDVDPPPGPAPTATGAFQQIATRQPAAPQGRQLAKFTVNGPDNVVRYGPDPYEGVGMSKDPSTWDHVTNFFSSLLGKGGDLTGTVSPSMFTGVVMNPRNAQWLKDALTQTLNENPSMTDANIVKSYMEQKYPWLSSKTPIEVSTGKSGGANGQFLQADNKALLFDTGRPASANVETIGHELTHSIQNRRDPVGLHTAYIPYMDDIWNATGNFGDYFNQSWEREARQGGTTAKDTFLKFINMIAGPPKQLDVSQPANQKGILDRLGPHLNNKLGADAGWIKDAIANDRVLNDQGVPLTIEDLIHRSSQPGQDRQRLYKALLGDEYHGITGESERLSGAPLQFMPPKDTRTIRDIILNGTTGPGKSTADIMNEIWRLREENEQLRQARGMK